MGDEANGVSDVSSGGLSVEDALVVADIQVQPRNPLGAQRVAAIVTLAAEVRKLRARVAELEEYEAMYKGLCK